MTTPGDEIERLRAHVTLAIQHGTELLGDLKSLDDRLTVVLPSLQEMPESEREQFVARLCGYDAALLDRVHELVGSLADLVAGLTASDAGAAWLRLRLGRLAAGDAEEAA
jgi:hypothetical protein